MSQTSAWSLGRLGRLNTIQTTRQPGFVKWGEQHSALSIPNLATHVSPSITAVAWDCENSEVLTEKTNTVSNCENSEVLTEKTNTVSNCEKKLSKCPS